MIDTFQELKLKILKFNLKQKWNFPCETWNEEIPYDYMFEDTSLQLSFVFNTFSQDELLKLIKLTRGKTIDGINKDIFIEINNYITSCVIFINYEINGETDKYFQKFKNNSCFSYEKKIKLYLNSVSL
tara:strand:+ start:187 stop:570 length:384 start_codon:yes stop_codon:yes gene_type:complete